MTEDEVPRDGSVRLITCAHEDCVGAQLAETAWCLAHAAKQDPSAFNTELKRISSEGTIDARRLPLSPELLDRILDSAPHKDDRPTLRTATFDGASFQGRASFDGVSFQAEASFRDVTFQAEASFRDVTFQGRVRFSRAAFEGDAEFREATFKEDAGFADTTFHGWAMFDEATFQGWVRFNGATFWADAGFDRVPFGAEAQFREVTFQGEAGFREASFQEVALFEGATFQGWAKFEGATFHGPARFGAAAFQRAVFTRATFEGMADYEDALFQAGTDFGRVTFQGPAEFIGVRFLGPVGLNGAKFQGDAEFGGASFHGSAGFNGASFQAEAGFRTTTFRAEARFGATTFMREARFDGAIFNGEAWFNETTFQQARQVGPLLARRVDFDGAMFNERVQIEVAAASLCARRAQFPAGVQFRLRWASVILDDANFTAPSVLSGVPPFAWLNEEEAAHRWQRLPPGPRAHRWRPRLLSLCRADVGALRLTNVDLRACRFAAAHNLDKLRIEGESPFTGTRGWWRARRKTLAEEQQWRASRFGWRLPTDWYPLASQPPVSREVGHPAVLAPVQISGLYRELRKGREDAKDEPGAADFYYGEMEMRRHDPTAPRVERLVLWLYWLLSGYGLRGFRALAWLTTISIGLAALLQSVGFNGGDPPFRDAMIYAAQSTVSISSSNKTLIDHISWAGEVLRIVLRLVGPLLLGLAVLSVRNRVKR